MNRKTRDKISNSIERTRELFLRAEEEQRKTMGLLSNSFPGIDFAECKTMAENADNLEEAINCYIQYGEYSIESILDELEKIDKD